MRFRRRIKDPEVGMAVGKGFCLKTRGECADTGSHGRVRLKERIRLFSARDIRKLISDKVVVSLRLVSVVMNE